MDVRVTRRDPLHTPADVLVIALTQAERVPRRARALDAALGGRIQEHLDAGTFEGKKGERVYLPGPDPDGSSGPRRVMLLGLGKEKGMDAERVRSAVGGALRAATERRSTSVGLALGALRRVAPAALAQAAAEGAVLGGYRFDKYRTNDDPIPGVAKLQIHWLEAKNEPGVRNGARTGVIVGESACLARDLSNEPGSVHTPAWLARQSRDMARQTGLRVRVLTERELEKRGMGAILAVGRGAAHPPRMIALEWGEKKTRRPTIALVGKGVTFDSGGISIKPAASMDAMKGDMSGGAAVIGAMRAVALLKLPLHVVGIVGAAMNMPDGEAYVPGDIVHTAQGKTIEVLNTDAEGRIVLADALHWATSWEPDAIVDLATLTGAKVIALGSACCGVMGNDEKLIRRIRDAGDRAHERAWQLPLWDEHQEAIKGVVGDLKNTGGRQAGSSTAAALLSHFVGDAAWAHLDIAGNERTETGTPYCVKGATGFGVRLLVELLRSWR
ncbi:MAG: leucyl aminopeptidase [Deltaproteobacteria bacterium]|nr:leucyl aminopeptidase [Deltaproteobacteria bacterium]